MKNIKLRSVILLISLLVVVTTQSCKKEDQPEPVIYKAFTTPVVSTTPAVKADGTVFVTGSTIELVWTSETGGNADNWTVYVTSDAGDDTAYTAVTKQSFTLPVEDGVTYTWHVEGVEKNGLKTTSPDQTFTAIDGTNPEMHLGLTTTTNIKSEIGLDLPADEVVDLRLFIVKKSDMSVKDMIDVGTSDEEYDGFAELADGEYLIGVDVLATINAGDFDAPLTLSLSLQFDQLGITDKALEYPGVMTNKVFPCDVYRTYLATFTKVGAQYTISSNVFTTPESVIWNGTDGTYPSEVTTSINCDEEPVMTGLNFGWMNDWWGEVIVDGGTLVYTTTATTIDIPYQYYCTTTYNGAQQLPYDIEGTGTIDNSGPYPVYTIHYDIKQDGTWIGHYSFLNYGWEQDGFDAVITTGPAGKSSVKITNRPAKPRR